jgi:hypothetical protein
MNTKKNRAADVAMREMSQRIMQAFVVLHRTARTHALANDAMQAPLQTLADTINGLIDATGSCEFMLSGTMCVANGVIAVPELNALPVVRDVSNELKAHNVGGFRAFARVNLDRARALTAALLGGALGVSQGGEFEILASGPIEAMLRELHDSELARIEGSDQRERACTVYAALLEVVQRTAESARAGQQVSKGASMSRVMRELIETAETAPAALLPLALLRSERIAYLPRHLAGTAILSVLVGLELKLQRSELLHVAQVALLHEVGVAAYGAHLETAGRDLAPHDRQLVKELPLLSARIFLRRRGLDRESLRNMVAAVECKRPYDQPLAASTTTARTMLGARIVQACSTFDAMTSSRSFRPAMPALDALRKFEAGDPRLDPSVLQALVSILVDPARLVMSSRHAGPGKGRADASVSGRPSLRA